MPASRLGNMVLYSTSLCIPVFDSATPALLQVLNLNRLNTPTFFPSVYLHASCGFPMLHRPPDICMSMHWPSDVSGGCSHPFPELSPRLIFLLISSVSICCLISSFADMHSHWPMYFLIFIHGTCAEIYLISNFLSSVFIILHLSQPHSPRVRELH